MNRRFTEGFIIIVLVIAMYFLAQKYSLYYIFWGYDWVQHFMGGMGIALVFLGIFSRKIFWLLGTTLTIAISWEIFERIGHIFMPHYISYGGTGDTFMDIFCAILGTSLVLLATRE